MLWPLTVLPIRGILIEITGDDTKEGHCLERAMLRQWRALWRVRTLNETDAHIPVIAVQAGCGFGVSGTSSHRREACEALLQEKRVAIRRKETTQTQTFGAPREFLGSAQDTSLPGAPQRAWGGAGGDTRGAQRGPDKSAWTSERLCPCSRLFLQRWP
ncbi:unnamed protein product [Prorocentrum cordatum]|uniref:Uncharacterized protein n=1 Tax=Prorocentrum cordatum TaxID=2364126 RepID=A0ABN9QYD5_9DINO|nr:unnamed protein product [Polarella glacialis]